MSANCRNSPIISDAFTKLRITCVDFGLICPSIPNSTVFSILANVLTHSSSECIPASSNISGRTIRIILYISDTVFVIGVPVPNTIFPFIERK